MSLPHSHKPHPPLVLTTPIARRPQLNTHVSTITTLAYKILGSRTDCLVSHSTHGYNITVGSLRPTHTYVHIQLPPDYLPIEKTCNQDKSHPLFTQPTRNSKNNTNKFCKQHLKDLHHTPPTGNTRIQFHSHTLTNPNYQPCQKFQFNGNTTDKNIHVPSPTTFTPTVSSANNKKNATPYTNGLPTTLAHDDCEAQRPCTPSQKRYKPHRRNLLRHKT